MDLDSVNFNHQNIEGYYKSVSKVEANLNDCQSKIQEIVGTLDQGLVDKNEFHLKINALLDQIQIIQNEMDSVQTGHFNPLNDLLQEIQNLKLDLSVQRKILISHKNILDESVEPSKDMLEEDSVPSPLWVHLKEIRETSTIALTSTILTLGIVGFLITGFKS
jgi:hypothetical protein